MQTLLLNPPPERAIEPGDRADYPHIGLGYIASYLRSQNLPVKVIDGKLEGISVTETLKRIGEIKPDIIGLTAYTQEIIPAASLAQQIKDRHPDIQTVIGGIHATVLPQETLLEFASFDFAIFGEGEITFFELIDALKQKRPLSEINGLAFRDKNQIQVNPKREWNTELDKLPSPAWDLFSPAKMYPLITARGCPFKCIFCTRPYGNKVRERSPQNVVSEFQELIDTYQAKNIIFFDETFGVNKKRASEIADMLIRKNIGNATKWGMHTRVNTVDYDFLNKLKQAGCKSVGFGVESGNEKILAMSNKGITLQQAKNAVKIAKNLGFWTNSYFILGLPNETRKTAWDTINFARILNTDAVSIAILIPFPGTEVAELIKQGKGGYKRISYNWSDYNKQTGAVVELKGLNRRTLVIFQISGYLMFYICNLHFSTLGRILKQRFRQILSLISNLFAKK